MPKYEKTGQGTYATYRKKPESNIGAIIFWIVAIIIVLSMIGKCTGS